MAAVQTERHCLLDKKLVVNSQSRLVQLSRLQQGLQPWFMCVQAGPPSTCTAGPGMHAAHRVAAEQLEGFC